MRARALVVCIGYTVAIAVKGLWRRRLFDGTTASINRHSPTFKWTFVMAVHNSVGVGIRVHSTAAANAWRILLWVFWAFVVAVVRCIAIHVTLAAGTAVRIGHLPGRGSRTCVAAVIDAITVAIEFRTRAAAAIR